MLELGVDKRFRIAWTKSWLFAIFDFRPDDGWFLRHRLHVYVPVREPQVVLTSQNMYSLATKRLICTG